MVSLNIRRSSGPLDSVLGKYDSIHGYMEKTVAIWLHVNTCNIAQFALLTWCKSTSHQVLYQLRSIELFLHALSYSTPLDFCNASSACTCQYTCVMGKPIVTVFVGFLTFGILHMCVSGEFASNIPFDRSFLTSVCNKTLLRHEHQSSPRAHLVPVL